MTMTQERAGTTSLCIASLHASAVSSSVLPTLLVPAALPGSTAVTLVGAVTVGSAGLWGRRLAQGTLTGTSGVCGMGL